MNQETRRYDIDWWRVITIFLVYLHHIGMPFNGDKFHIMNHDSSKVLDDIMVYFEQFRLPLLFLVSGIGTVYAFSKRTAWQFAKERTFRLFIPLIFGVIVIVPPQYYVEHITEYTSVFDFLLTFYEHLEVNHLWFIKNLFYISLLCIPLIKYVKSEQSIKVRRWLEKQAKHSSFFILSAIPLIAIKIISKSYFPSDSSSITNLSSTLFYLYFFIAGIGLSGTPAIWLSLKDHRLFLLNASIISSVIFYAYYFLPNDIASAYFSISQRWNIWFGLTAFLSWILILTALAYGQIFFNKKSVLLRRLNEGIYPFYVLHQTVIVVIGYYVIKWDLNLWFKILSLVTITFPLILIIYRYSIIPFKWMRFVFGMKTVQGTNS